MNSKKLFIIITAFVTMMVAGVTMIGFIGLLSEGEPLLLYFFVGAIIICTLIACLVGRYVYLDSRNRGMNVWTWTLIAMYVPNLIGLLLYVIVRKPKGVYNNVNGNEYGYPAANGNGSVSKHDCPTCSFTVADTFEYCPNCGEQQHIECPACHAAVINGWAYCPSCGRRMPGPASSMHA